MDSDAVRSIHPHGAEETQRETFVLHFWAMKEESGCYGGRRVIVLISPERGSEAWYIFSPSALWHPSLLLAITHAHPV